jgi:hypothetical protein
MIYDLRVDGNGPVASALGDKSVLRRSRAYRGRKVIESGGQLPQGPPRTATHYDGQTRNYPPV